MKKIKKLLCAIIVITIMASFSSVNAAVAQSGGRHSYTFTRYKDGEAIDPSLHGDGSVLMFEVDDMIGTCIQVGVNTNDTGEGEAILTKVDNTDLLAKVAYYWGVVKGYAFDVESFNYNRLTRANQYTQNPTATEESMISYEWSEEERANVVAMVEEARSITVPSSFVIYKGDPTDDTQSFAVWKFEEFTANKDYNQDTPYGLDHAPVTSGNTIKYDITWNNGRGTITITDVISKGLSYVTGSANLGEPTITNNTDGSTKLVWTTTESQGTLTYSAKVASDDLCVSGLDKVQNNATITVDDEPHPLAQLENPIPRKCYAPEPNDGYDHKQVSVGDDIVYQIVLPNITDTEMTVVVTDTLSKGLTFNKDAKIENGTIKETSEPKADSNSGTKVSFTITIPANASATLTYSAKVNSEAGDQVKNNAVVEYDGETINLNELDNPLNNPEKIVPVPDTGTQEAIIGLVLGSTITFVGGYFIYRKYKEA